MNCPTCGAENEADARFCAECGTPLEGQADQPPAEDDDRTILSTVSEISGEAEAVAVNQEDVANGATEIEEGEEAEFETEAPSPPPSPPAVDGGDSGNNTQRYIIIAVVVLLVLCCCCGLLASIIGTVSYVNSVADRGAWGVEPPKTIFILGGVPPVREYSNEDIINEFTLIRDVSPNLLAFI